MMIGFNPKREYVAARDFRYGAGPGSIFYPKGAPVQGSQLKRRMLYRRGQLALAPEKETEISAGDVFPAKKPDSVEKAVSGKPNKKRRNKGKLVLKLPANEERANG